MDAVLTWLRQPTSVAGLATTLGTVTALVTGQLGWQQAIPILAGAAASILLPDNAAARLAAASLAQDAVAAEGRK